MSKGFDLQHYWSDMATTLVNMKRFKSDTVNTRKVLGIPERGLPCDQRAIWYKSLFSQSDIDPEKHFSLESTQIFLPPNKFVIETIEKFANEFNLDERWYVNLLFYLGCDNGVLYPPFGNIDFKVRINDLRLPEKQRVVTHLSIVIDKDTSINDIEKAWSTVEKYQAKMRTHVPQRRRQIDNTEKYIYVRKLEDDGNSQQKIADNYPELYFKTASDVANFKKEIEKRFKPQK